MINGLLIGYDTASSGFVAPGDAEFIVCYGDRLYENEGAAHARFPNLVHQGRVLDLTAGSALWKDPYSGSDIEPGNAGPSTAANYVNGEHARGVKRPAEYADLSDMQECLNVLAAAGIHVVVEAGPGRPLRIYTAHPNGVPHLCGPPCGLLVWADITQFWWSSIQGAWHGFRGDLDVNAARPDAFLEPVKIDPYAIFYDNIGDPRYPNKGNERLTVEEADGALKAFHDHHKYHDYLKGVCYPRLKQFRDRIWLIATYEPPFTKPLKLRPARDWGGDKKHPRGPRWQLLNDRMERIAAL